MMSSDSSSTAIGSDPRDDSADSSSEDGIFESPASPSIADASYCSRLACSEDSGVYENAPQASTADYAHHRQVCHDQGNSSQKFSIALRRMRGLEMGAKASLDMSTDAQGLPQRQGTESVCLTPTATDANIVATLGTGDRAYSLELELSEESVQVWDEFWRIFLNTCFA